MEHNQEKAIALNSLYNMVIDCVISGYVYINYQRYGGIPCCPKHKLFINGYIAANGSIRIRLDKKHNYWISKYDQT